MTVPNLSQDSLYTLMPANHDETEAQPSLPSTHPASEEWMAYLYEELPARRRQEIEGHLAGCRECAAQLAVWRAARAGLDAWQPAGESSPAEIPARSLFTPPGARRLPVTGWVRWAAAAAITLCVGFGAGRWASPGGREVADLRRTVAQLAATVEATRGMNASNTLAAAREAAAEQSLRLLSEYSQQLAGPEAERQQALFALIRDLTTRVQSMQTDLETVALNTRSSFEQTGQNLARLAIYHPAGPAKNPLQ